MRSGAAAHLLKRHSPQKLPSTKQFRDWSRFCFARVLVMEIPSVFLQDLQQTPFAAAELATEDTFAPSLFSVGALFERIERSFSAEPGQLDQKKKRSSRRNASRRLARKRARLASRSAPPPAALQAESDSDLPQITVAVIDSGIDLASSLLRGALWSNPGEVAGDGIDNDGNGFVDDISGWDFVSGDPQPDDLIGHGTQMAGLVLSAAANVSLMPLKVVSQGKGGAALVAQAIDYAVANGASVLNLSLNAPKASDLVDQAVARAQAAGVTVLAAAGNKGQAAPEYPANLPGVIAVGESDADGDLQTWSSRPGAKLAEYVSTRVNNLFTVDLADERVSVKGTSAATARLAGYAASMLQQGLRVSADAIKQFMPEPAARQRRGKARS
jgi:hypothetical protein